MNTNDDHNENNQYQLDEVISPIFGHDYKNRILNNSTKNENKQESIKSVDKTINYLEKQIAQELEKQNQEDKVKEYEESYKSDTDVLKQYHKQKEEAEIKAALPSNYLDFRDSLEKTTDLSIISDFSTSSSANFSGTISEIVDDIFDYQEENN